MGRWPFLQFPVLVTGLIWLFLNFSPSLFVPTAWRSLQVERPSVGNIGDVLEGPSAQAVYEASWSEFSAKWFRNPWVPYRRDHLAVIGIGGIAFLMARRWRGQWEMWLVVLATWASFAVGVTTWGLLIRSGLPSPAYLPAWSLWPLVFLPGLLTSLAVLMLPWLSRHCPKRVEDPVSAFRGLPYRPLPLFTLRGYSPFARHVGESPRNESGLGGQGLAVLDSVIDGLRFTTAKEGRRPYRYYRCSSASANRLLLLVEHELGFVRRAWCLVEASTAPGSTTLVIRVHRLYVRSLDWYDLLLLRVFPFSILRAKPEDAKERDKDWVHPWGCLWGVLGMGGVVLPLATYLLGGPDWLVIGGVEMLLVTVVLAVISDFFEANEPSKAVERATVDLVTSVNLLVPEATGAVRKLG